MDAVEARRLGWGDKAEAFAKWRNKVNEQCLKISGVSTEDLGDADFASMFTDGFTPRQAAIVVLQENDFPFEED